jgi:PAS domain S-box-containing protein
MFSVWQTSLMQYGVAVLATILATILRKLLDPALETAAPFTAYFIAIMVTAWYGGFGPSVLALVSGAVLADYCFVEPRGSLVIHDLEHQVSLGLFIVVGVVVATLSELLHASRRRTESARIELAAANRALESANSALEKEITERRQAEQWLLESEQRFRGYFEQGLVGMAILSERGEFMEVNERLCQLLGYSERELIGRMWNELTYAADASCENAQFKHLLERTASKYVMDKRFVRKGGGLLYAKLSVQSMRKSDGEFDCILVLAEEATNSQQTERHGPSKNSVEFGSGDDRACVNDARRK